MESVAHGSGTFVGRDAELAELAGMLGITPDSSSGGPARHHVLLAGDAGVGKTRLLSELCGLAGEQGHAVYVGHCLDFGDSALPYLPFSEVLGRLVVDLPDVVERVAAAFPSLARLQPGVRLLGAPEPSPSSAAGVDRAALFDAVHSLLEAVAEKTPVVLAVEDTHWADQSTRDLLTFLFTRPFTGPVAIVASYRADDLHRRHPLRKQVAEWARLPRVDRLVLDPLDDEAVRRLVLELAGPVPEEQLARIVSRAEGNAFFVEELVGAASGPDRWVPEELADVLLVRLDRLDDTARTVVRTASVAGRQVSHNLLAAVSGLGDRALDEGLRHAVESHVLVAGEGRYSFRHALLGEAVYDDLLPGERVRLHAEFAAALAEGRARGTAAELARHALLAGDPDTAIAASIRAGDEAAAVGGPDEAGQHYEQALDLLARGDGPAADPTLLADVVVKAAGALVASGHHARAAALAAAQLDALPAGAPALCRARLLMARAEALFPLEAAEEPVELARDALAAIPDDAPDGDRVHLLGVAARIFIPFGYYEEGQAAGLEALAMAERLGLPDLVSDAVTTLSGLKKTGPKEGLRAALREAIDRAEEAGALQAELRGRFLLARSYEDWGEYVEARTLFRSALDRAVAAGTPWAPYGFESRHQLMWLLSTQGDWDGALALADTDKAPPLAGAMLDTLRLAIQQARGADVDADLARLRPLWSTEGQITIRAVGPELASAGRRGDVDAALAVYRDAVAVLSVLWAEWFSGRVRLAAQAIGAINAALPSLPSARREEILAAVARLRADAVTTATHQGKDDRPWGPEGRAWAARAEAEALRAQWLAGSGEADAGVLLEAWRDVERHFADLGHVYETASVRTVLAGVLRATGDLTGAREAADSARAAAQRLGAVVLLDELTAQGLAPVAAGGRADAVDALTPRETEILALVAEGLSNGEVAKRLFISTKTVSVHVSNILGKLGAGGRTEAAAIARRRGLLG